MRSYWVRVGPKSTDWCLYKREGNLDRDTQREDGHLRTEAEIGVMHL